MVQQHNVNVERSSSSSSSSSSEWQRWWWWWCFARNFAVEVKYGNISIL
jgi:hypothetical protein